MSDGNLARTYINEMIPIRVVITSPHLPYHHQLIPTDEHQTICPTLSNGTGAAPGKRPPT